MVKVANAKFASSLSVSLSEVSRALFLAPLGKLFLQSFSKWPVFPQALHSTLKALHLTSRFLQLPPQPYTVDVPSPRTCRGQAVAGHPRLCRILL